MGPNTPAQAANRIIEDGGEINSATGKRENPNGIRRARRIDVIETYYRAGRLSPSQFQAAETLASAWENTQRSPSPKLGEKVDSSPKPDHAITIQIDQMTDYIRIMGRVDKADKQILTHCVLDRHTPYGLPQYRHARRGEGMQALRDALDRLAGSISTGNPPRQTALGMQSAQQSQDDNNT